MPYDQAAEVTNRIDWTDPEEQIREELPDGFRITTVLPGDGAIVEHEVDVGGWEEIARFTHPHAGYDWAMELAEKLQNDSLRVVFDWNAGSSGEWLLEGYVESED